MVLLPRDLTQNEAANAGIYKDLVQSEVANAALHRDCVQIESDNVGAYLLTSKAQEISLSALYL